MKYEFSDDYNPFLCRIPARVFRNSPQLLHQYLIRSSVDHGRREVNIWFRTAGCRYFLHGGCAMCNYLKNPPPKAKSERIPFPCPQCYKDIVDLLDQSAEARKREVITALNTYKCPCKAICRNESTIPPLKTCKANVFDIVSQMAQQIMGEEWTGQNIGTLQSVITLRGRIQTDA